MNDVQVDRTKKKRRLATLLAILAVSFSISFGTTVAYAGNASSSTSYPYIGGVTFENWATVNTSPGSARSMSLMGHNDGSTPVGHAGARGRLFTSGGSLSCEGSNTYNSATNMFAAGTSCWRSTSGTWYGYGVVYGWDGTSYAAYYTFKTPNQSS